MRGVRLIVRTSCVAAIGALSLVVNLETLSRTALLALILPLVLHLANWPITILTSRISENILSRKALGPSKLLERRRDLELRRNQIEELLMRSPGKDRNL